MPDFESNLKKYRQLAGLTQEELAQRVGVRRGDHRPAGGGKIQPLPQAGSGHQPGGGRPIEEIFVFES